MLALRPISLRDANKYISENHRHHKPVQGHKFSISCVNQEQIVGVVIVGRPVSRNFDDGLTAEVTRLCTDGTKNACSMLYGAAWRASKAMGYKRIVTYTLPDEGGTSLRAAGWRYVGLAGGGNWNKPGRKRQNTASHLLSKKSLYEAVA